MLNLLLCYYQSLIGVRKRVFVVIRDLLCLSFCHSLRCGSYGKGELSLERLLLLLSIFDSFRMPLTYDVNCSWTKTPTVQISNSDNPIDGTD